MKLYSVCFGLVIIMFCQPDKAAVVSDFCRIAGPQIRVLKLSSSEAASLTRERLGSIAKLRRDYQRLCKPS